MNRKTTKVGLYFLALGFLSQVLFVMSEMISGFELNGFSGRGDILNIASLTMIIIGGIIVFMEYLLPFLRNESSKNNTKE